ncbi:Zinc finger BED domain-containing protein 5 [Araneus ventricosus]|uniref:Zinc finger BED domain-containing protein 5 n=1 Tax=Araneus ventricosus TaxID=182803 RepID=A0A4Y2S728_ARAVE|nr:Zinc finger BED domain-containing protein 5 [Araneus ventricosus]
MASYLVSYRIAQAGEAHTVAENLIKPCVKDIIECMFDEKAAKVIDTIPLSNDTISRRIGYLAENVKSTLISRIKSTKFSLQMDESTDVAGLAILMVIVRYPYLDSFHEDLLICKPLPTITSGTEIFKLLDKFFAENSILWDNCVDVCTDGAKAMTGKMSGAIAKIKEKAKGCSSSHCILHRHALAMKKMPPFIREVLSETVKIINFIKSRPKNNRLFKILCDDMGSMHTSLLLHTEIRWLSRGKSLIRLFELRNEVGIFLRDNNFALGEKLCDERWLMKLAYLADIFKKINDLYFSLQGKAVTVFDATDQVEEFKKKLKYWVESIKTGTLDCFPITKGFGEELESDIPADILNEFEVHLLRLIDAFNSYFPKGLHENIQENVWVVEPYSISVKPSSLTSQEYECLLDLTSDTAITSKFKTEKSISDFWCTLKDEFKILSDKAKLILLPFATTYLVETGFSAYTATKTKYR